MKKPVLFFGILLFLVSLIVAQKIYRFDVLVHPVNYRIKMHAKEWGGQVNLIPDIFSSNESLKSVDKKLIEAGYSKGIEPLSHLLHAEKITKQYTDMGKNYDLYIREANAFPCNIVLAVFVEFEDRQLKNATGTQYEQGCL